jgi:hypothetical protein
MQHLCSCRDRPPRGAGEADDPLGTAGAASGENSAPPCLAISGISKTFSITGWRVGYVTVGSKWIPTIGYFHDLVHICAPGPSQFGAAAGLVGLSQSFCDGMASKYQQKRSTLRRASRCGDAGAAFRARPRPSRRAHCLRSHWLQRLQGQRSSFRGRGDELLQRQRV